MNWPKVPCAIFNVRPSLDSVATTPPGLGEIVILFRLVTAVTGWLNKTLMDAFKLTPVAPSAGVGVATGGAI